MRRRSGGILRPSDRFPTLETRICDVSTRLDDTITIAAIIQCMTRACSIGLRRDNQRWRLYDRFLINENRWRAQRYGISEGLIDFGRGELVPYEDLRGGTDQTAHARCRGTRLCRRTARRRAISSSAAQVRTGSERCSMPALAQRKTSKQALDAVVDGLIAETTLKGL